MYFKRLKDLSLVQIFLNSFYCTYTIGGFYHYIQYWNPNLRLSFLGYFSLGGYTRKMINGGLERRTGHPGDRKGRDLHFTVHSSASS